MKRIFIGWIIVLSCTSLSVIGCDNIALMQLRYPSVQRLASNIHWYLSPRWSPDGSRIIFTMADVPQYRQIAVMNSDGSEAKPLTDPSVNAGAPDWSPDGKRIVFSRTSGDTIQVYVMNADGTDAVQLTHSLQIASCPKWSPGGKRIAFCGWPGNDKNGFELYVMNADGTNVVQLTHYPLGNVNEFEWSPDSLQLAFVAEDIEAKKSNAPYLQTGPYLYLMNADGTNQVQLLAGNPGVYFPTWSPDGKQILFSYLGVGNEPRFPDGFHVIQADGTERQIVLAEPTCEDPNWSRASNEIVFVCDRRTHQGQILKISMEPFLKQ
jgi:TolB protein